MGSTNEELIDEFGDALDEWAKEIKHLCRASGVQQQQLASRLTELSKRGNVDPSRVSKWLSGRKIVVTGGAALPGRGLSQDIVRALGLQGAQARRVLQLGERIDLVQVQLERRYPTGWRAAAQAHFRSSAKTARTSSSSADDTAGSSAGEASLPSVSQCQDASEVPLVGTTVTMVAADDEKTKAQPPLAAGDEPSDLPRHVRGQRLWRGQPKWIKALATVTAVAVTVAAVITAVVGSDGDERTGDGAEGSSPQASASMGSSVQERPEAVPSESLGLEKGTLGENSRCSIPFTGPGSVAWRVCARVEAEQISFALKITNHGNEAATVKVRLEYAQANQFHQCPKKPTTDLLRIAARKTVITDPGQCAVPREEDTPFSYQGVGWVLAKDATTGSYKLSPNAHVYPDRVIWQPDLMRSAVHSVFDS